MIDIIQYISYLFLLSFLYLVSVFYHETGHIIMFKKYLGYNPKISYGKGKIKIGKTLDYIKLNRKQRRTIYFMGVLFGFLPIMLMGFFNNPIAFVLLPAYILGCRGDIKYFLDTYEVKF